MNQSLPEPDRFFNMACLFEAGLALLAIGLGWVADIDPFSHLTFSEPALVVGLLGTLPLIIVYFALQQIPYAPLRHIQQLLQATLGPKLHHRSWHDWLLLAGIAGFAEELLFRGLLQPWLENAWGLAVGLWVSNVIFALVHAVTPLYALLALLMGLYMALALDYGGERHLLTPMIIHGVYDFVAFVFIMREYRRSLRVPS